MIGYLNKEPSIKRMLIILTIFLAILILLNIIINIYLLNLIHKEQVRLTQKIVGRLVSLNPEREFDIVNAVFYKDDITSMTLGESVLMKYGYDIDTSIWEDINFKNIFQKYIAVDLTFFVLITMSVIFLLLYGAKNYIRKLERLSANIDDIMNGIYKHWEDEEGVLGRISVQTHQMSRRLSIGMEKLKREKENIKSLVTDISHQVKTPLSSIMLFNTLLLEDDMSSDEVREFLHRSKKEIDKLEWLIQSLIKISRMETGMIKLKIENNSVKDTIYDAVYAIIPKSEEKNIKVEVKPIEEVYINHDTRWTKEAIFNVLENSVKYTREGGFIKINLIKTESYVRIDIEDNGIGIPKEEYNDIFKRFYRGKSDVVKRTEGSGVGLYLTRKILEEQGGSIIVSSKEGYGTRFSLYLPYKTVREYESLL